MSSKFESLVNDMVNVSIGVAATAVEVTQEVLGDMSAKGEQVRHDKQAPDFARSMADIFHDAGGVFTSVTEGLETKGETVAERILDELIVARVKTLTKAERVEFLAHVRDLVDAADDSTVTVEVEVEDAPVAEEASVEEQGE